MHTLSAQASSWDGAQSPADTITFTLDTQPPDVALATAVLEPADTYQIGSGIMRFSGLATDTLGLAAVQLRIGSGPFADTTLNADGSWSTARWLGAAAYGQSYRITVRAIDRAGQVAETTQQVLVNIAARRACPGGPARHPNHQAGRHQRCAIQLQLHRQHLAHAPLHFECRIDGDYGMPVPARSATPSRWRPRSRRGRRRTRQCRSHTSYLRRGSQPVPARGPPSSARPADTPLARLAPTSPSAWRQRPHRRRRRNDVSGGGDATPHLAAPATT